jgi:hypothetical protein
MTRRRESFLRGICVSPEKSGRFNFAQACPEARE